MILHPVKSATMAVSWQLRITGAANRMADTVGHRMFPNASISHINQEFVGMPPIRAEGPGMKIETVSMSSLGDPGGTSGPTGPRRVPPQEFNSYLFARYTDRLNAKTFTGKSLAIAGGASLITLAAAFFVSGSLLLAPLLGAATFGLFLAGAHLYNKQMEKSALKTLVGKVEQSKYGAQRLACLIAESEMSESKKGLLVESISKHLSEEKAVTLLKSFEKYQEIIVFLDACEATDLNTSSGGSAEKLFEKIKEHLKFLLMDANDSNSQTTNRARAIGAKIKHHLNYSSGLLEGQNFLQGNPLHTERYETMSFQSLQEKIQQAKGFLERIKSSGLTSDEAKQTINKLDGFIRLIEQNMQRQIELEKQREKMAEELAIQEEQANTFCNELTVRISLGTTKTFSHYDKLKQEANARLCLVSPESAVAERLRGQLAQIEKEMEKLGAGASALGTRLRGNEYYNDIWGSNPIKYARAREILDLIEPQLSTIDPMATIAVRLNEVKKQIELKLKKQEREAANWIEAGGSGSLDNPVDMNRFITKIEKKLYPKVISHIELVDPDSEIGKYLQNVRKSHEQTMKERKEKLAKIKTSDQLRWNLVGAVRERTIQLDRLRKGGHEAAEEADLIIAGRVNLLDSDVPEAYELIYRLMESVPDSKDHGVFVHAWEVLEPLWRNPFWKGNTESEERNLERLGVKVSHIDISEKALKHLIALYRDMIDLNRIR